MYYALIPIYGIQQMYYALIPVCGIQQMVLKQLDIHMQNKIDSLPHTLYKN